MPAKAIRSGRWLGVFDFGSTVKYLLSGQYLSLHFCLPSGVRFSAYRHHFTREVKEALVKIASSRCLIQTIANFDRLWFADSESRRVPHDDLFDFLWFGAAKDTPPSKEEMDYTLRVGELNCDDVVHDFA
jgi:hypothetical protein